MSVTKRIAFAVASSWVSRVVSILAKLFLIPILFRYLGKEELGIWFILSDSQGLMGLLGFGVVPTLTRHIALKKGNSGSDPNVQLSDEASQEIADLVFTGQVTLKWLAVMTFFVSWIVGYGFIGSIKLSSVAPEQIILAWTVICFGYAINVWVAALECWLVGMGYVGWDNLILTVVNFLSIITSIIVVMSGGGLVALAITTVSFSLLQRLLLVKFIKSKQLDRQTHQGRWSATYFRAMVNPSLLAWFTNLTAFLIFRTDNYFIALFKGTAEIPVYFATYQLVLNLFTVASSFMAASPVFISQAWQAGDLILVHKTTIRSAKLGLLIMSSGIAFLVVVGQEVITLWLGKDSFVGYPILLTFCLMFLLEIQHATLGVSARSTEFEKFAIPGFIAAVLNFIITWFLVTRLGLLGVALGTMLAQLLTNNWYAVYVSMIRLKINFNQYFSQVTKVWVCLLLISIGFSWVVRNLLLAYQHPTIIVISGVFFNCCVLLAVFFWNFFLENSDKISINKNISRILAKAK